MSVSTNPAKQRTWLWPALFVVGIAGALIISGIAGRTGPNGAPLIKSGDEYQATLLKANELWKGELEKQQRGEPTTAEDTAKLREASRLYDSLTLFNPVKMGPYFASGQVHLLLGENDVAAIQFRQAIDDAIQATNDPPAAVKQLTADSQFGLATAEVNQNQFAEALPPLNDAISAYPQRGDYRYLRARVYIQLKKLPEAVQDLQKALEVNPGDHKALSLLKFVQSAPQAGSKGSGS